VSPEPTGFLYPFIEGEERDAAQLLADLGASARAKMAESQALRSSTLERATAMLEEAGRHMASCFEMGGRLFAFGNGGSATDAEGTVALLMDPPTGRSLPAVSLAEDRAVLTALANDVGFELAFSRQIIAHARAGDIAVGFSTSGDSINVRRALEEAARRGLLTIGLCGYEGGAMATSDAIEYCLVVDSDSVHRIQEAHNALIFALWEDVQRRLGAEGVP
jgi:D-sedoheptulose 7-phosphate isomerase